MRSLRLFVSLLVLGFGAQSLSAANYPFPPTASWTYSYGIKPANPSDASWSADWTALANKWATYKLNYVTTSGAGSGERIICSAQQSGDTVSEGIGYGMILAVYFNDETTFNDLYVYEQSHLDSLGLMNWDISSSGSVIGSNSASDGDEDIAYALWLAHYQWGDGGTYNYTQKATTQTDLIQSNDLDGDLRVKPGDSYDSCQYPSYFMPSEYVVFGNQLGTSSTWKTVASNSYQTIQDACNGASGLIADQTADTGVGGSCSDASSTEDQYNSCRVPFYMALDYVYNGTAGAKTELDLLQSYFNGVQPSSVDDCYTVNQGGTSAACSSNINHSAFIGPAGCALMVSSGSAAMLQTYYNYLMSTGTTSYFDESWNLLSLLLMQGNMPNIADPAAIYSPTSTPSDTPYAGTPTLTPTQTPIASGVVFEDFEYGQLASGYTYASTAGTGSTSTQAVNTTAAESGLYGDDITWSVVTGGTSGQYGGVGFNSNYANDLGVINATGTNVVQIFYKNTGTAAFTFYLEFKEGGTTTTAVAGGHGFQWDSLPITVPVGSAWDVTNVALSSFTLDKYAAGNVTSTSEPGTTMAIASMMTCQIQTDAVWAGSLYVDNIVFLPTTAFTPTASPTPLVNPYTQIWDDFESPLSLSKPAYCDTYADTATGASASWATTSLTGDFVAGSYGGALTYNTGTSAGYGCGGDDVSPYSNSQLYCNDSGAAYLAFYINAPKGFRYQSEFQEAGVVTGTVQGADGAAWLSDMQTAAGGWQYVELPIANFTEDPYDLLCNPNGIVPSPCLSEGDTEQMAAIQSVSFKLAAGQGNGVLYFDNIAFITTWKTPTVSPTPSGSASFTRSPSPTASATPTRSPTPTWTASFTSTPSDSPTATDSPTSTWTASPTYTWTVSPSPSPSSTPSDSPTFSVSPSQTASHSATPTPSNTPATPTVTATFTSFAGSPTDTYTGTISPTDTLSATLSVTSSDTDTPSVTPTPSSTVTLTSSLTTSVSPSVTSSSTSTVTPATPTDTPMDSPTESFTPASPTDSPSNTPSVSVTPSQTPASPTDTVSVTGTQSATPTFSATSSVSPALSATDSPSPGGTASATATATATASPSSSPTESFTPPPFGSTFTATPQVPIITGASPANGTGTGGYTITVTGSNFAPGATIVFNGETLTTTVLDGGTELTAVAPATSASTATLAVANPTALTAVPGAEGTIKISQSTATPGVSTGNPIVATQPNPDPNPIAIWVDLRTSVDSVQVQVYSMGFRLIGTSTTGPLQAGWNKVPLPYAQNSAGSGLYYYIASVRKNGSSVNGPKGGKFFVLTR
jgi:endo-1,4-beta-D-glucanase Y